MFLQPTRPTFFGLFRTCLYSFLCIYAYLHEETSLRTYHYIYHCVCSRLSLDFPQQAPHAQRGCVSNDPWTQDFGPFGFEHSCADMHGQGSWYDGTGTLANDSTLAIVKTLTTTTSSAQPSATQSRSSSSHTFELLSGGFGCLGSIDPASYCTYLLVRPLMLGNLP